MKYLITTVLLLVSFNTFAQTGFIEVEVTDTVWMKPLAFEYNITLKNDRFGVSAFATEDADEPEETEKTKEADAKQKLATLTATLSKKGYTVKSHVSEDLNIFGMSRDADGIAVTVKSAEQLEKLKAEVKSLDYADGHLAGVDYGDKTAYDARLYKKLIDAARKKAQTISGLSGQKLGKIAEVKEPSTLTGMENYMKQAMKLFESMQNKLITGQNGSQYGELTKTVMIKFSAE